MGAAGAMIQAVAGGFATINQLDAQNKAFTNNFNETQDAARFADLSSVDALSRGALASGQQRMKGSALLAKQRVSYANSGVDAYSGTPSDVASGTALFNELDALTIENNAAREALGHRTVAARYRRKAKTLESQNKNDQTAAALGVVSNLASFGSAAAGAGGSGGGSALGGRAAIDSAFNAPA